MSLLGQSHRFDRAPITSGPRREADILRVRRHVSKVPTTKVPASFVHPRRSAQKAISGAVICSLLAAVPRWHKIAHAAPESASNWPRSAGAKSLVPRLWAHEALDVSADHIHVCLT